MDRFCGGVHLLFFIIGYRTELEPCDASKFISVDMNVIIVWFSYGSFVSVLIIDDIEVNRSANSMLKPLAKKCLKSICNKCVLDFGSRRGGGL